MSAQQTSQPAHPPGTWQSSCTCTSGKDIRQTRCLQVVYAPEPYTLCTVVAGPAAACQRPDLLPQPAAAGGGADLLPQRGTYPLEWNAGKPRARAGTRSHRAAVWLVLQLPARLLAAHAETHTCLATNSLLLVVELILPLLLLLLLLLPLHG